MNRIYVIATVIGLVLATVVASQTVLISSSYQSQIFDDFIENSDDRALTFGLYNIRSLEDINEWIEHMGDVDSIIEENNLILNYTKTSKQQSNQIIAGDPEQTNDGKYVRTLYVQTREYTQEIFDFYSSLTSFNSSVKFNLSEPLLIVPFYYDINETSILNYGTIEVLADSEFKSNTTDPFNSIPIHNVNYFMWTQGDEEDYWQNGGGTIDNFYPFSGYLLLNASAIDELMVDIFEILADIEENGGDYFWFDVSLESSVYIELPEITTSSIDNIMGILGRLETDARGFASSFEKSHDLWIWVYSPLYSSLQYYEMEVAGINTILLLVTGPLIALALFLVYFSLTLVEQRKQRVIAILKVRGSSKDQLYSMMLSEAFSAALMAVIAGMILSIPWTLLTLRASGILQFDNPAIPINIPASWYWRLPLIGIIFALDLNMSSIASLSTTKIDEGEITEEKRKPFWQRYYLDLILLSLSIIFWISMQFIPGNVGFIRSILVIIIGPFTMIIFMIGAPLVTARYFSTIIGKISDVLWRNFSGMIALATRNMRKNKFSASRLVSFLLLGMMLSYVSVIIPTTFIDWNTETTAYSMGSEIYISGMDSSNATQLDFLNIPEIDAYSEVTKLSLQTGYNNRIESYTILGVDTDTFEDAAFWRNNYDDKSLSKILDKIDTNSSMGMQTETMLAMGVEIDDYLQIDLFDKAGNQVILEFNVTTSFDYFPNLVNFLPYSDGDGGYYAWLAYGLVDLDTAKSMAQYADYYEVGTYVNVKDKVNVTALAISLRESFSSNTSISVYSIDENTSGLLQQPAVKLLLSSLQGMTIITVIASILAVSYFSFISLSERKREIGVFRALGMVRSQIFMLLVAEGIIILSMGITIGGLAGYSLVYIFFQFMAEIFGQGGGIGVPPLHIVIPWDTVGIFTLLMFVLTLVAAAAPAQYTANQQTGSILRAE
jgi:ABC-type lipoprotein release transport system permease subunit